MTVDAKTTSLHETSIAMRIEHLFGDGAEELANQLAQSLAKGFDDFSAAHVLTVAEEFAANPSLEQNRPGWAHQSPLSRAAFDWLVLYCAFAQSDRPAD